MFLLVDMRDVADSVTSVAAALPTESVSTYLEILDLAAADGSRRQLRGIDLQQPRPAAHA